MDDLLKILNNNAGALTILFSGIVTFATVIYAGLTWALVKETRMMREVQTEPKLQVSVNSFDFAVHIVRLNIRNIGLGPALDVVFNPRVLSGGVSAEKLLSEFTDVNFFSVGLKHFGPGQERVSGYTELTQDHDGKIASILTLDVTVVVNKDVASSHAAFLNSSGGFRSGFSQTSSFNSQSRVVPVQRSG